MTMRAGALSTLGLVVGLVSAGYVWAQGGDPEHGREVFSKCKSCHAVGENARNKAGPHLNGIFGRRAGAIDAFRYSKAMLRAGADGMEWGYETLDRYIENPKSLVSRTRMNFRGIADPADRADVIAYLRRFSDNPRDIPEAAPTAAPDQFVVDPAILALDGDTAFGEYLSTECVTCHQATGADEGIPSITGWPRDDFVVAMHAYKAEARPHPVMRMIAGRLSDEEIASLAAYFEGIE